MATTTEIKNFVITSLSTKNGNDWIKIDDVPATISSSVKTCLNINIEGYKYVLEAQYVRHIHNRHGAISKDRMKLIAEDYALLPAILKNPDTISRGTDKKISNNKTLIFKKKIGEKNYYLTVCDVRNRHKSLAVNSLLKRKNA